MGLNEARHASAKRQAKARAALAVSDLLIAHGFAACFHDIASVLVIVLFEAAKVGRVPGVAALEHVRGLWNDEAAS